MSAPANTPLALFDPVTMVKGVSTQRAALLGKLGINSVFDLVTHYPSRYIDMSQVANASDAPLGRVSTVVGRIAQKKVKHPKPRLELLEVALVDDTGLMVGVWFNQPWMVNKVHVGDVVSFTGKVTFEYGCRRMSSPVMEVLAQGESRPNLSLFPIHRGTEGLSATWVRRLVANALEQLGPVPDPLPAELRSRLGLMGRKAAFRFIHFPPSHDAFRQARRRLAFEEVLRLQLEMMSRRNAELAGKACTAHERGASFEALGHALPFALTADQERAVADIVSDMEACAPMNRMLLGDVGTGKTAVAAHALCLAADSQGQAAMMAPTEVLARQYASSLGPLLDKVGVSWCLLTGSTPAKERQECLAALAAGAVDVAFGTHALIEPDVVFSSLSLVVIDEQHRFGVEQRSALRGKGGACDLLVMTATPIPRTLALALYGDLRTSFMRQRPASRPPVSTTVISRSQRHRAYDALRQALSQGQQGYVICPLVGLDRKSRAALDQEGALEQALGQGRDVASPKAAFEEARHLATKVFPGCEVGLLTGPMPSSEKKQVMEDFRCGKIQILVSTTVVEVGVDVPNATVMLVEDAERFGLSQLHQLRGRVGRGTVSGKVFLVADPSADDEDLKARLSAIQAIDDGFELALADLKQRREGDVLGSRQHGAAALKLVNVIDDAGLVECAHKEASRMLEADPLMTQGHHCQLAQEIKFVFADAQGSATQGA